MNSHIYVPILKSKQAEEVSLRELNESQKKGITPLLQLVHQYVDIKNDQGEKIGRKEIPKIDTLKNAVNKINKRLNEYCKIYFDVRPLFSNLDDEIIKIIFDRSNDSLFPDNNIIPVLTLLDLQKNNFNKESNLFLKEKGICLRIYNEEINQSFWDSIDKLLSKLFLKRADTDLIFDYRITNSDTANHFITNVEKQEKVLGWRSLTLASGAFYKNNFIGMKPDTYEYARIDWSSWKNIIDTKKIFNKLNYGDYATQYPIYEITPVFPTPSRSIRFSTCDKWIVLKGQSDRAPNSTKEEQYGAEADLLISKNVVDKNCCACDEKITNLSQDKNANKGHFYTWVKLGLLHHFSTTLRQISQLR